ncbi:MAG TPA: thiol:disulfide interchange protein DsbA/DsbL [Steroidobacteraceae bacterium]|jgi:thiol:disulfide interchange protein DsbA
MTRKLTAVLVASAAAVIVIGAYLAHRHAPQQASQTAAQTAATAAPAATTAQAASGQAAPAAGGPVSTAQAADAGSTSLEHLAAVPASAALPSSSQWKAGTNYDVISPAEPTTVAPGKVEVLEVFWLGCPHCYALEPYIRSWLKSKPDYIQYVRVPVMWGPVHRAHARLFYTLESLGGDDLVEKAFTYIHDQETQSGSESVLVSNSQEDTFRQQQAWAVQNGVNADAFAKAYNSFYVNTQLQQADEITNAYQVQGVPFIAIDGKFTTDVGKASGGGDDPKKLLSVIDFLAAWEHDHKQGGQG